MAKEEVKKLTCMQANDQGGGGAKGGAHARGERRGRAERRGRHLGQQVGGFPCYVSQNQRGFPVQIGVL